jgi:hypothetical protein
MARTIEGMSNCEGGFERRNQLMLVITHGIALFFVIVGKRSQKALQGVRRVSVKERAGD